MDVDTGMDTHCTADTGMDTHCTADTGMDGLVSGLSTMNLSAMTAPDSCRVIWHYAELSISPDSFSKNIDWRNQVIRLKHGQTSVFINFTYFTGFRRKMQLSEIMARHVGTGGLPRIETLKEWAASDLGLATIFKDSEVHGLMTGNYLAVPIMDNADEIHMCIIGLVYHKIGYLLRISQTPTQKFTMFVDLSDGFQNHLSITGAIQATGVNIFKAIFELLKKRPITDYLDLIANLPPTPFIQMVYNIKAYFPELQVAWAVEPSEKAQKELISIDTAPLDRAMQKCGRMPQLEKLHDKWLGKRENSVLFKSMVGAVQAHGRTANSTNPKNPTKPHNVAANGKQPARFSALWPEVMDVVAD
jgi:hypothetical protein